MGQKAAEYLYQKLKELRHFALELEAGTAEVGHAFESPELNARRVDQEIAGFMGRILLGEWGCQR
jgi:hypothetical protein